MKKLFPFVLFGAAFLSGNSSLFSQEKGKVAPPPIEAPKLIAPKDAPKEASKETPKEAVVPPDAPKEGATKTPTIEVLSKKLEESSKKLDDANAAIADVKSTWKIGADTVWVMITGMLVFFMNLGFACVEAGMCRAKNCVNILSKRAFVN